MQLSVARILAESSDLLGRQAASSLCRQLAENISNISAYKLPGAAG
jgi:hypothetical protein